MNLAHTYPYYPSPPPPTVLGRRDFRGGRGVSEDLWRAGENLTVLINEFHHSNSFKPLAK